MSADYSESARALDLNIEQLFQAIDMCREYGLAVPAQVLLYTGLATMGELNRPKDKEFGTRSDFKK